MFLFKGKEAKRTDFTAPRTLMNKYFIEEISGRAHDIGNGFIYYEATRNEF